jgi:hypothetical protein
VLVFQWTKNLRGLCSVFAMKLHLPKNGLIFSVAKLNILGSLMREIVNANNLKFLSATTVVSILAAMSYLPAFLMCFCMANSSLVENTDLPSPLPHV